MPEPHPSTTAAIAAAELGMAFTAAPVLEGISFAVTTGEFVAIVGPSGCGKSTLLRLIAGLEQPTSGTLTVHDTTSRPLQVAFVFQEPALLPWRTVADNIALPLELDGVPRADRAGPVAATLELVGLEPADASKRPRELSGGMRMRAALARALVTQPDLLLLDEPFAAVDDILRHRLNEELHRMWRERGWTAVFVTHNVAEAVYLADRVLVMSAGPGRIAAEVPIPLPSDRTPELRATPEFAKLTGTIREELMNVVRGE